MRPLRKTAPRRILVRGTNWVGDAVMTLPALKALAEACPQADIHVLAKPWVAPIYRGLPHVNRVKVFNSRQEHKGACGVWRLARELSREGYDWAVLFQNAVQAALISLLARVPRRIGYDSDGRGLILTHAVRRLPRLRRIHETSYYIHILKGAGIIDETPPDQGVRPELSLADQDRKWAEAMIREKGLTGGLLGIAPGAAFGPAKCWPADRYAKAAAILAAENGWSVLLFGSKGEREACSKVAQGLQGLKVLDLSGRTSLGQALALLERLSLFLTNDSGLMHAAAALGAPTVAVFGSTNPITTSPLGERVALVRKPVDCSPCLKPECPRDMRCFTGITVEDVAEAARGLLAGAAGSSYHE